MSIFSERLSDIMSKRNISQKELAILANVTESAMSYYVNGVRTPRSDVISNLARILGVTTDYLLGAVTRRTAEETQFQYLQRNLAKLNPEQLDRATQILKIVFYDVFDEMNEIKSDLNNNIPLYPTETDKEYVCSNTEFLEEHSVDIYGTFLKVLSFLKRENNVSDLEIKTWFTPLKPVMISDQRVVFEIATEFQKDVIMKKYKKLLTTAYKKLFNISPEIDIQVNQ